MIFAITCYTILLLLFSSSAMDAAKSALSLCYRSLIPSLFPFFVCSNLLINLGAASSISKWFFPLTRSLFGLSGGCALPIFLGMFCGYPVGAKTTVDLYQNDGCSKSEAEKLLAFCNNSGPAFVIGAVGYGMLKSGNLGIILYLSHILSAFTIALCMHNFPTCIRHGSANTKPDYSSRSFGELFPEAIASSALLTLNVCGFAVFFSTLISLIDSLGLVSALASLGINSKLIQGAIYSFFECGGGCNALALADMAVVPKLMLLSSALGWSGISVHVQVLGIIKKAKLSPKLYFKGKALMTIISPLLTLIIYLMYMGRLSVLPFVEAVFLFLLVMHIAGKLFKTYSRYRALPPR